MEKYFLIFDYKIFIEQFKRSKVKKYSQKALLENKKSLNFVMD